MGSHIEKHVGLISQVFHEIVSDLVHIDLYHVQPSERLPYQILVTCGMSQLPMNVPDGASDYRFLELVLVLPPSWPMEQEAWRDESHYWPIRQLKSLARFPHVYQTWLYWGHTVQNDHNAPFDSSTKQNSVLIGPSLLLGGRFATLEVSPERTVSIFAPLFIYPEELAFKIKKGGDALFDRLVDADMTEEVDPHRPNTCKRWWRR